MEVKTEMYESAKEYEKIARAEREARTMTNKKRSLLRSRLLALVNSGEIDTAVTRIDVVDRLKWEQISKDEKISNIPVMSEPQIRSILIAEDDADVILAAASQLKVLTSLEATAE